MSELFWGSAVVTILISDLFDGQLLPLVYPLEMAPHIVGPGEWSVADGTLGFSSMRIFVES